MNKKILIDAYHQEETRVAVVDEQNRLLDYDFDSTTKKTIKGNVYLAKVVRVEPSLQAAFVDYGEDRHGFLVFNEIHPDYFRIPVSDREALEAKLASDNSDTIDDELVEEDSKTELSTIAGDSFAPVDEETDESRKRRPSLHKMYKIQEVIHKNQIVLVQVTKEERGQKGAALTTYVSLAGRYCVLMPNSPHAGGVSRKISNISDRKKLKDILSDIEVPNEMGLIIRTAGRGRTKTDIKRDVDYLKRSWNEIRELTLKSIAPSLVYQEESIIKRAIRDQYHKDVSEVIVSGDEGYKAVRGIMKQLLPSHSKKVKQYKDIFTPLFVKYDVEKQIDITYDPIVMLPSGGSIVIHPTEALVAIDINSGKATKERNVEATAFNTNIEAAEEIARQVRLRELAGLIVIDFIDMEDRSYIHQVEKKIRESFKHDKARVQMNKISPFGLLELSRQRLRPSILEINSRPCVSCSSTGYVRSVESMALLVLRSIQEEGIAQRSTKVKAILPTAVAMYIFNHKNKYLTDIQEKYNFIVELDSDDSLIIPDFKLMQVEKRKSEAAEGKKTDSGKVVKDIAKSPKHSRSNRQSKDEQTAKVHDKPDGQQHKKSRSGYRNKRKPFNRPRPSANSTNIANAENNTGDKGAVAANVVKRSNSSTGGRSAVAKKNKSKDNQDNKSVADVDNKVNKKKDNAVKSVTSDNSDTETKRRKSWLKRLLK